MHNSAYPLQACVHQGAGALNCLKEFHAFNARANVCLCSCPAVWVASHRDRVFTHVLEPTPYVQVEVLLTVPSAGYTSKFQTFRNSSDDTSTQRSECPRRTKAAGRCDFDVSLTWETVPLNVRFKARRCFLHHLGDKTSSGLKARCETQRKHIARHCRLVQVLFAELRSEDPNAVRDSASWRCVPLPV